MKLVRLTLGLSSAFVALSLLGQGITAAPQYSSWSEPINLGSPINSTFNETAPSLSKDRLALYFTSTRPCGAGDAVLDFNIWVAHRNAEDAPWGAPECLAINVDGFEDSAADFSRDGHWLFFVSDRPGSQIGVPAANARDIWVSRRAHIDGDDWGEPVNAGSINSNFADAAVTYFEGDGTDWPQVFFASSRSGTFDIWQAAFFGDGTFGAARRVDEISTPTNPEARPSIRHDGLEMFFFRGVSGSAVADIYSVTRSDTAQPWSEPMNLGAPLNTAFNDQQPYIASDRTTLYIVSNRSGSMGANDLWISTREKEKP